MSTKWVREVEKVVKKYPGLRVVVNSHIKIVNEKGKTVCTCSATPSDRRALKNVESTLRNAMKEDT